MYLHCVCSLRFKKIGKLLECSDYVIHFHKRKHYIIEVVCVQRTISTEFLLYVVGVSVRNVTPFTRVT